jgi:cardiolipin synthase
MLIILTCVVVVIKENRNPIRSLAWLLALIFLPFVGFIFYIFFGRSLRGKHMISRNNKRKMLTRISPKRIDLDSQDLTRSERNLVKLARNLSSAFYTVNNRVEIFTSGVDKFAAFKRDLLAAKESIFLQYYIFLDDEIGREIADILICKAQEGLEVKVIYDNVGSFSASNKFFRRMKEGGVDTHPFFRVTFPQFANRINWRNHRKVTVIDGKIGYVGGMNIADRYVKGDNGAPAWRDTHFRLEGDIIDSLLYSFVVDWNFKKTKSPMEFRKAAPVEFKNNVGMQFVTSGPMGEWDNLALCFLKAISSATKRIYIQTPYFLPTEALKTALQTAALAKLDVRIMIPAKGDSRMVGYASRSFITECLKSGIKVYFYKPGMIHSKCIIIDDELVTAGSTNFDFRSFENNFECNLIIYDRQVNEQMREIFFEDIKQCVKPSLAEWKHRRLSERCLESVFRLFSPIL